MDFLSFFWVVPQFQLSNKNVNYLLTKKHIVYTELCECESSTYYCANSVIELEIMESKLNIRWQRTSRENEYLESHNTCLHHSFGNRRRSDTLNRNHCGENNNSHFSILSKKEGSLFFITKWRNFQNRNINGKWNSFEKQKRSIVEFEINNAI